jgi:hypothetical protein
MHNRTFLKEDTMLTRSIATWSAVAMLACAPAVMGAADVTERFTFSVPNTPESILHPKDGRFQLTLHRWSSDAERDALRAAAKDGGAANLLVPFREVGAIGTLQWPGGLEYSVRYARRTPRPDGQVDVVLLADRGLWVWWDDKLAPSGAQAPLTVVHVRLAKDGKGEGRVAFADGITADTEAGIALTNFSQQPLLLNDVRQDRSS